MIKRLSIKNFYSYANQGIEFAEGINAICGNSRSGKTTVRRAIEWVLKNRPNGLSLVSYWNRGKKNDLKESTEVEVETDNGSAKRIRSKDTNGYIMTAGDAVQDFDAVGTSVPEMVQSLFNFSEINLQKQFDSPFMLSESASDVARFFNKTIRLDVIDKVLGLAESKRRKNNQVIETLEKEKDQLDKDITSLSFLDEVGELLERADKLHSIVFDNGVALSQLETIITRIMQIERDSFNLPNSSEVKLADTILSDIQILQNDIYGSEIVNRRLVKFLSDLKNQEHANAETMKLDTEEAECTLNKIQTLKKRIENSGISLRSITAIMNGIVDNEVSLSTLSEQLHHFQSQAPTICQNCPLF